VSDDALRNGDGPLRRDLVVVGATFVLTRLLVVAAAYAGAAHPNPGYAFHTFGGPPPSDWLAPFIRWDAQTYYVDIARNGYPPARIDGPVFHAAFFPVYPLIVRAIDLFVGNTFVTGLLLSNLFAFATSLLLCRLPRALGQGDERRAAILFLAAPGSDFLSFPYSESLFCFLTTGALLATLRDRPWLAGALGALASATRPTGLVVTVMLLVAAWNCRADVRPAARRLLAAALSTAGLAAWAVFCLKRYGDALYFSHIQAAWGRQFSLLGPLRALFSFRFDPDYYVVTLAALAGAAWLALRGPAVLAAPAWFLLLVPLATGSLKSMIRFQSANIPLLAGVTPALSRRWFQGVVAVSLLLLAYETYEYAAGYAHN
jgi:hypothetical protein